MTRQIAQMDQPAPANEIRILPFRNVRQREVRRQTLGIVPAEHYPVALFHRPTAQPCALRDRSIEIRNVIAHAVRPKAPAMKRAAYIIALKPRAGFYRVRMGAAPKVRARMRAIGFEHEDASAL